MTNNQLLVKENAELINGIAKILTAKKQIEAQEKELREKLLEQMEKYDVLGIDNDTFCAQYIAPTTRDSIDTKALRKDHPDLAKEYTKTTYVSSSIRFKVK